MMARHLNEDVIQELYRLGTILADRVDRGSDVKFGPPEDSENWHEACQRFGLEEKDEW
jgi:hypothetical protein